MVRLQVRPALPAALCGALALAVGIGLGRFGFTATYPLMVRDHVIDVRGGAISQAAHFIGYFVGAAAIVRLPRERVAVTCAVGLAACVVLMASTAFASGLLEVSVARFMSGVASGVIMVTASTWIFGVAGVAWAPVLYGGAGLGIVAAGESIAGASGVLASGREAWLVLAAACAVLAVPAIGTLVRARDTAPAATTRSSRPDMTPARLVPIYAASAFGYVVSATYLPLMVARATGGLDPIHVFSFFGLCAMPSCVFWLWAERGLGLKRTLAANLGLQVLGTVAPLVSSQPLVLIAAAGAIGATFMGVVALAMSAGRHLGPGLDYNLMAVLTAAYAMGQALGPGVGALIVNGTSGLDRMLGLAGAALAAAAIAACAPASRRRVRLRELVWNA